jgi:hypothetical protein
MLLSVLLATTYLLQLLPLDPMTPWGLYAKCIPLIKSHQHQIYTHTFSSATTPSTYDCAKWSVYATGGQVLRSFGHPTGCSEY